MSPGIDLGAFTAGLELGAIVLLTVWAALVGLALIRRILSDTV